MVCVFVQGSKQKQYGLSPIQCTHTVALPQVPTPPRPALVAHPSTAPGPPAVAPPPRPRRAPARFCRCSECGPWACGARGTGGGGVEGGAMGGRGGWAADGEVAWGVYLWFVGAGDRLARLGLT